MASWLFPRWEAAGHSGALPGLALDLLPNHRQASATFKSAWRKSLAGVNRFPPPPPSLWLWASSLTPLSPRCLVRDVDTGGCFAVD